MIWKNMTTWPDKSPAKFLDPNLDRNREPGLFASARNKQN